jgi:hypothetical protein
MRAPKPVRRPDSALRSPGCGQRTTVFVTAAQRQGRLRRPASLGFWLLPLTLFGCSTFVTATSINPPPRPLVPRAASSVQVLASTPPAEPHVDVALLEVEQQEGLNRQGTDYMIQRLREKAAELGCDAVYIKNASEHEGEDSYLDPDAHQLLATCIVFTPPSAARERDAKLADTQRIQAEVPGEPAQPVPAQPVPGQPLP